MSWSRSDNREPQGDMRRGPVIAATGVRIATLGLSSEEVPFGERVARPARRYPGR